MRSFLSYKKYSFVMVYFRARWNPQCIQSDKHIQQFVSCNSGVQVIKIDTDEAAKIKKNYGVKSQPEFVFCLYGTELIRQIGPNAQLLQQKLQRMQNFANSQQYKGIEEKWLPYQATFEDYQKRKLDQLYTRYVNDI